MAFRWRVDIGPKLDAGLGLDGRKPDSWLIKSLWDHWLDSTDGAVLCLWARCLILVISTGSTQGNFKYDWYTKDRYWLYALFVSHLTFTLHTSFNVLHKLKQQRRSLYEKQRKVTIQSSLLIRFMLHTSYFITSWFTLHTSCGSYFILHT